MKDTSRGSGCIRRHTKVLALAMVLLASAEAWALDDGLARTPPMGWASWNAFQWRITESIIQGNADALVSSGLSALGYTYMLVDLGWQAYAAGTMRARFPDSTIKHDAGKFPAGMAALATYIRNRGLRYAAYTDCGYETCGGMTEGSRGFEYKDMRTFAAWGADYVKVDFCGADGRSALSVYTLFRDAIRATGRPMVFSICCWGNQSVQTWGDTVGHLWRTTGDIDTTWTSIVSVFDRTAAIGQYSGPGHWNDPDMLQVGNGSLTADENQAHFTMWCMLAAPLMLGNDLRSMSAPTLAILSNTEAIAVDQDPLGISATKKRDDGDAEVWVKRLADSSRAVMLFNRGTSATSVTVNWSELGWSSGARALVRDLWQHADKGMTSGSYSASVPAHGAVMLKVTPEGAVHTRRAAAQAAAARESAVRINGTEIRLPAQVGDELLALAPNGAVAARTTVSRAHSADFGSLPAGAYVVAVRRSGRGIGGIQLVR